MKLLFHLHTKHSYDSRNSPQRIVEYCMKQGIDNLAITDHETINGSKEAFEYCKKMDYSLNVIIGAEYKTNAGDVIGLFLKHEYKETDCLTLIRKIKADGGVVILPHPFQGHKLTEEIVKEIDIIETFNPRCTAAQNQKAIDLATKFNKPQIAGADAHLMKELNKSLNILNGDVIITALFNEKEMITTYSSKFNFLVSQYIKALKKKEPVLFLKTTKSLISYYFIQPLRNRLKN